jgi:uncharacterized YccA/Bax inhibitor family protein
MRTSNPAFRDGTFSVVLPDVGPKHLMTIQGAIHRAEALLLMVVAASGWAWIRFSATRHGRELLVYILLGFVSEFAVALLTILKPSWSPITAPIYAVLEGLCLGVLSAALELRYPGIVIEAVVLTFGTCFCLLLAYQSGLAPVTKGLRLGVVSATGGIAVAYLVSMVMPIVGIRMPYSFARGPVGIIISLVIVAVAALNLAIDFDFIERGAQGGAPKYMEWYAAFGLMLTLTWLYLEILRLLTKVRDDRP